MPKLKKNVDELKVDFKNVLNNEEATQDEQMNAMEAYYVGIANEMADKVKAEYEELKHVTDNNVLQARGIYTLTAEETKFYNEVKKTETVPEDMLLPETVIERVFDDLQKERPLLQLVTFVPGAGKQKIITSHRHGKAVWGPLHRDLEGQLDATFRQEETSLQNLTAYFLISNDTLDLGPRWIDRFIRLCLQEAIAEAWEEAIVNGSGVHQPIGLLKDLDAPITTGEPYKDKEASATLTFENSAKMVDEMGQILKDLSVYNRKYKDKDGEEKTEKVYRKVLGQVKLIINPANYYDIVTRVTTQNANGVFVTNLPFISADNIVESEFVPEGKLIAFLEGGYDAQASHTNRIYEYPQTFAMKRATLYAIDVFGDGKPRDNDVARVYDLEISDAPRVPEV